MMAAICRLWITSICILLCIASYGMALKLKPLTVDGETARVKPILEDRPDECDRDSLFEESVCEAEKVVERISDDIKRPVSPRDLFDAFRAADDGIKKEIANAAEVIEKTVLQMQKKFRKTDSDLRQMLSKDKVKALKRLAHCPELYADLDCEAINLSYRTFDGTCNNLILPTKGAALLPFNRMLEPRYENDFNEPQGWNPGFPYNGGFVLPGPRSVSTAVMSTAQATDDDEYTGMFMQWGQFTDHDLDFTPTVSRNGNPYGANAGSCEDHCKNLFPCFPIAFPPNDPRNTNAECMSFIRSAATCTHHIGQLQPRQQFNAITAYMDGSNIYGSSEEDAKFLRDLEPNFGLMRTGPCMMCDGGPLLPFDTSSIECIQDPAGGINVPCFIAGDARSNEQPGLTTIHTIFLRYHNCIANKLRTLNSQWDGDKVYQETRKIIGAIIQRITYNEYLPLVLGDVSISPYSGYDPNEDATIFNAFATSAFRFGHATVQPLFPLLDDTWQITEWLKLHQTFFSPYLIVNGGGIDPFLRGLLSAFSKLNLPDEVLNEELTERLFAFANVIAFDLAALNIQRGRDHGLPTYLKYREKCGLQPTINSFPDLTNYIGNEAVVDRLEKLYGDVNNIDLFVGGMLEGPEPGARVGAVFHCIISRQFKALRDGDRNPTKCVSDGKSCVMRQPPFREPGCMGRVDRTYISEISTVIKSLEHEHNGDKCALKTKVVEQRLWNLREGVDHSFKWHISVHRDYKFNQAMRQDLIYTRRL